MYAHLRDSCAIDVDDNLLYFFTVRPTERRLSDNREPEQSTRSPSPRGGRAFSAPRGFVLLKRLVEDILPLSLS